MSSIIIQGDTSGSITVEAPSVAGTHTLTLPKATGNIATDATVGLGTKNLIINGDMRIAQRATSVSGIGTNAGYYTCDRWLYTPLASPTGVFTQTQDTDVPTGQGFSNSLKMQCTTAQATMTTTQQVRLETRIEGQNLQHLAYGTANAKKLTLSFWVKTNKTGSYIIWLYQDDDNRMVGNVMTISTADTWEKITWTIDGDTTGVIDNDNGIGLRFLLQLCAGPDRTSGTLQTTWAAYVGADQNAGQTVNFADSTSNYINITGVQLEVGENATPFENRMYSQELAMCQRYYWKMSAVEAYGPYGMGHGINSTSFRAIIHTPQTMRAYPSLGFSAASTFIWSFGNALTNIVPAEYSSNAFSVNCTTTGVSANGGYLLTAGNNTTSYIEASAEL